MENRLEEKLKKAGGIVARQQSKIEERADALIEREQELERRTEEAFVPHENKLDGMSRGLDDLERQLTLLSNGSPLPDGGQTSPPKSEQPDQSNQINNGPTNAMHIDRQGRAVFNK